MSSELQENLVTGSESLVHVQKEEIPTGDLLDFSPDNFAEPSSTTTEDSAEQGVEEIPMSSTKDSEDGGFTELDSEKKKNEDNAVEEVVGNLTTEATDSNSDKAETGIAIKP